jgi:hypothetical protein
MDFFLSHARQDFFLLFPLYYIIVSGRLTGNSFRIELYASTMPFPSLILAEATNAVTFG